MLQKKKNIRFGDKVHINSGFYEGETAILTYMCPESGCFCGFINGDGTEQLHYFYEDQIDVVDGGYYFPYNEGSEAPLDEANETEVSSSRVIRLSKTSYE